jgi:iron complex outermembrane receptor protein
MNGHRLVSLGSVGTANDPTSIPLAAIERVEVLTDGASSTYGSDAVAGVINVILRKDLNGLDFRAIMAWPAAISSAPSAPSSARHGAPAPS